VPPVILTCLAFLKNPEGVPGFIMALTFLKKLCFLVSMIMKWEQWVMVRSQEVLSQVSQIDSLHVPILTTRMYRQTNLIGGCNREHRPLTARTWSRHHQSQTSTSLSLDFQSLFAMYPHWSVSEKRMRKILQAEGLTIMPSRPESSRTSIRADGPREWR
jgi:hypothetical protein